MACGRHRQDSSVDTIELDVENMGSRRENEWFQVTNERTSRPSFNDIGDVGLRLAAHVSKPRIRGR